LLTIEDNKILITKMIHKYCRLKHGTNKGKNKVNICEKCNDLLTYAIQRIEYCPFGTNKPACSNCKIHCYNNEMRTEIKKVMKFSGPRVIFSNPVLGVKFLKVKFQGN